MSFASDDMPCPSAHSPRTVIIAAPHDVVASCSLPHDWLSSEELHRLSRFRSAVDQRLFKAAHLLKRFVLSQMLHRHPSALSFGEGLFGKPFLRDSDVHFSLSYRNSWVGLAFDRTAPVGLDIEQISGRVSWDVVLPNLAPLPAKLSAVQYWTAIEATLKAQGTGFASDPRRLQMCATEDGFQTTSPDFASAGSWCPADDHHLIAVAGGAVRRVWHLPRTSNDLITRLWAQ